LSQHEADQLFLHVANALEFVWAVVVILNDRYQSPNRILKIPFFLIQTNLQSIPLQNHRKTILILLYKLQRLLIHFLCLKYLDLQAHQRPGHWRLDFLDTLAKQKLADFHESRGGVGQEGHLIQCFDGVKSEFRLFKGI